MTLDRRTALILLAVIVAVGAWLRFHDLGVQSIWEDEAASWFQSSRDLGWLIRQTAGDNYPPLHNLLLFATIRLFGDGEWPLRLPSAIAGTLNIIVLYGLTARLGGRFAGLLAALLLALSGFHLWYSQEARPYALYALLATLFAWSVFEALTKGGRWRYVATGICASLLLYSHPFGTLTWLCILAGVVLVRLVDAKAWKEPIRRLVLPQACAVLSFLPWAAILAHRASGIYKYGFWIDDLTLASVLRSIQEVASGPFGLAMLLIGTVIAVVVAVRAPRSVPDNDLKLPLWAILLVLGAWTAGPTLLGVAESLAARPLFISRYVIGSLPAFIALAALGLASMARQRRSALAVAFVAVAGAVAALLTGTPGPRPDSRAAVQYLAANLGPGDCAYAMGNFSTGPARYYMRHPPPCFALVNSADALQKAPAPTGKLYLLVSTWPSPQDRSLVAAAIGSMHAVSSKAFDGFVDTLYER